MSDETKYAPGPRGCLIGILPESTGGLAPTRAGKAFGSLAPDEPIYHTLLDEMKARRDRESATAHDFQNKADDAFKRVADLEITIAALTPPAPASSTELRDAPPAASEESGGEIAIPEGFIRWEGCEWTGLPSDMVQVIFHDEPTPYVPTSAENLEPLWAWDRCSPDAQRIIAYRIIEAETNGGRGPEQGDEELDGEDDDASEFATEDGAADPGLVRTEAPETSTGGERAEQLIDSQTCEPVNPRPEPEPLPEPVWNEPVSAKGSYQNALEEVNAATDAEIEAAIERGREQARLLVHYDPKAVAERERFNPFRQLFGNKRETEDA